MRGYGKDGFVVLDGGVYCGVLGWVGGIVVDEVEGGL